MPATAKCTEIDIFMWMTLCECVCVCVMNKHIRIPFRAQQHIDMLFFNIFIFPKHTTHPLSASLLWLPALLLIALTAHSSQPVERRTKCIGNTKLMFVCKRYALYSTVNIQYTVHTPTTDDRRSKRECVGWQYFLLRIFIGATHAVANGETVSVGAHEKQELNWFGWNNRFEIATHSNS